MGNIFRINTTRKIIIASLNTFITPVKHPSRTLNEHIISCATKSGREPDIGGEITNAKMALCLYKLPTSNTSDLKTAPQVHIQCLFLFQPKKDFIKK